MGCELDSMSELSGFVYIKNHVILHVKSKAQKVNFWEFLGISRFLEPELLWLGIPRNSQSKFTVKIHTFIPRNS